MQEFDIFSLRAECSVLPFAGIVSCRLGRSFACRKLTVKKYNFLLCLFLIGLLSSELFNYDDKFYLYFAPRWLLLICGPVVILMILKCTNKIV